MADVIGTLGAWVSVGACAVQRHTARGECNWEKFNCVIWSRQAEAAVPALLQGLRCIFFPPTGQRVTGEQEGSLDVGSMSKTPPNRRGISFEVGAQLEARDSLKNWYAANIEKVDFEGEKILVHYRQWSHRYDEWFDWTSPYLRPVERVTLRRQGLQDDAPVPYVPDPSSPSSPSSLQGFHVNDKVLASWSDCRFYPAKVLSVNKDASYTVKFYDGVIQTVKEIHVKPFIKERGGGKSRSSERTMVRRAPNRRRPQENGGPKSKRARRSTSDREEDSNSEQDEREQGIVNEKNKKTNGELSAAPAIKQEEEVTDLNTPRDLGKGAGLPNGVKEEKDDEQSKEKCVLNGEVKQEEMETKPYTESPKPYAEESPIAQMEQVPVSMTTTESKGGVEQKPNVQSEGSEPAADVPPPVPVKLIKNQPPPVLSINLDHNPFKCSAPGCTKSFRKAKLLHYHMKYYHGEEQPLEGESSPTRSIQTRASEKQTTPLDGIKRRRTISASLHPVGPVPVARGEVKTAGRRTSAPPAVSTQIHQQRALLREKSKENHLDRNGCQQLDSDKSGFDIGQYHAVQGELLHGSVKDKLKQKQKDFLRIKLKKKKKKKKAKSDDDSMSDWSTDSCGWNVTTPPLSVDSGAVDTNDQELVRCICEVEEENDFMIQCEDCLCWQHGTCMGLLEDNVPDRYNCYICRDPPGQRQSLRYWYDREWLINGHMYGLSFLEENYSHQNAKKITTTHQLLGDVHHVVEILSGLQIKMNVLQSNTHPDLQLWRQPWKHLERSWTASDSCRSSNATPDEDMSRGEILMSNALEKLSRAATAATSSSSGSSFPFPSFQDSYIISEHCYQKPRAYYPAVEQRLVAALGGSWSQAETREEAGRDPGEAADNSRQHQQRQINLLDHIDAVQDEVSHRMDFIERELDVLESWLDYTGELEPPEPLARLPQLKHRMKRLLTQLGKVQQIALYSST
ncbi:hypothetical protein F7725_016597 [Dissostichus mawsoni]|uniref:C2H2-type domain-containing protein n=1 Tax=Dissostichus mawsoni TaxID=36200 RepID=A0A7J5Z264_DISMA|nr:hypothetical protein F7725_016597 [Dissostichus mawsoni]